MGLFDIKPYKLRKNSKKPRVKTKPLTLFQPIKMKSFSPFSFGTNKKQNNKNPFKFEPVKMSNTKTKNLIFGFDIPKPARKVKGKRALSWSQAKMKFPNMSPHGDADKDGVKNWLDCRPFDPMRQAIKKQAVKKKDSSSFIVPSDNEDSHFKSTGEHPSVTYGQNWREEISRKPSAKKYVKLMKDYPKDYEMIHGKKLIGEDKKKWGKEMGRINEYDWTEKKKPKKMSYKQAKKYYTNLDVLQGREFLSIPHEGTVMVEGTKVWSGGKVIDKISTPRKAQKMFDIMFEDDTGVAPRSKANARMMKEEFGGKPSPEMKKEIKRYKALSKVEREKKDLDDTLSVMQEEKYKIKLKEAYDEEFDKRVKKKTDEDAFTSTPYPKLESIKDQGGMRMNITQKERDYIEDTYGDELENIPSYEVKEAIEERRENDDDYYKAKDVEDYYKAKEMKRRASPNAEEEEDEPYNYLADIQKEKDKQDRAKEAK